MTREVRRPAALSRVMHRGRRRAIVGRASVRTVLVMLSCAVVAASARASGQDSRLTTIVPQDSRFEVLHAPAWLGLTLRVDKFLGRVWVLQRNDDGEVLMYPVPAAEFGIGPDRVNYQLVLPDTPDEPVYLVALHTGLMWQLKPDGPYRQLAWRAIKENSDRARLPESR